MSAQTTSNSGDDRRPKLGLRGPLAELEAIPNTVVRSVTFSLEIRGEPFELAYHAPDPTRPVDEGSWRASRLEVTSYGNTAVEALENCVHESLVAAAAPPPSPSVLSAFNPPTPQHVRIEKGAAAD